MTTEPTRTATFDPSRYVLKYWTSPNQFCERPCQTLAQAYRLVDATGIAQSLEASVWGRK
jgi:hypothetical protein